MRLFIVIRLLLALLPVFALSGCAIITGVGKDNTPAPSALPQFRQIIKTPQKIWSNTAGKGSKTAYFNLVLTENPQQLFTADYKGLVTSLDRQNGKIRWQINLKKTLSSGPAANNSLVLIADDKAGLYALNQLNGKILWQVVLSAQITAPPVIADNKALIKTLDGQIWALSLIDGHVIWHFSHEAPLMALSKFSRLQIINEKVISAYSDGTLSAYSLSQGKLLWETRIAEPQGVSDIEQMIDIAADMQISGNTIYAAAYQGNLAAVNAQNGRILWRQPLSSYTGLTLSETMVYATDAQGILWGFNRFNGQLIFKQTDLKYRQLTAPVLIHNLIAVGDKEGYLHLLNPLTGETAARLLINRKTPVIAAPVISNNKIYILASNGLIVNYSF